ncbi:MAG: hypothetical protein ABIC39_00305, partial [Pseudomonadota bacterium]
PQTVHIYLSIFPSLDFETFEFCHFEECQQREILMIEAPRRKQRGIFDRKEVCYFWIRSLTPPQAVGNALAFAVQVC